MRAFPAAAAALVLALAAPACKSRHPQLQRGDASVVVTPAQPAPAGAGAALTEVEPNGKLAAPSPLELTADELDVAGSLAEADDEDRYLIVLPGPPALDAGSDAGPPPAPTRQLAIELQPGPGAVLGSILEVSSPEGRSLARSSGGPGQTHAVPNLALVPGARFLLAVRRTGKPIPAGPAASYRLVLRTSALGAGDEREPNESAAEATPLGPVHTTPEIAGLATSSKDLDWFAVPLGTVTDVTLISVTLETPPELVGVLGVHDGAGNKVAATRGRAGGKVTLRNLAPAALAAGSPGGAPGFFIVVRAEGSGDRSRPYLVRVRADEAPNAEREPNDVEVRATAFPEGTAELEGLLGPGDVDFFRLAVVRGRAITLRLAPPARADVVLEAFAPGESSWAKVDAGRRGQAETLTLTPVADGALLVRVSAKRGSETGDDLYRIGFDLPASGQSP